MIDVHYYGTLFTCKAAWPHFQTAGYGRIVNTTSESIFGGYPDLTSYGPAKGAVYGFTRNLATEAAGTGIHVNAIAPRGNTRMADAGKERMVATLPGSREQVEQVLAQLRPELNSPAVAFLAHESCDLNGEVLQVGSGRVARLVMVHTPGITGENLTAEDIAANIETILDVTDAAVPGVTPSMLTT
jgi:NAD(P)-dependent dehydrogenase (short-subunit alcohol dehydrogenase family)